MAGWVVDKFLDRIWGDQQAYVDIPSIVRVNGEARWIPYTIEWPDLRGATRRIRSCVDDEEDVYFSPCMFLTSERRAEDALPTRWLWADIDKLPMQKAVDLLEVDPTILWRTSPKRYQAMWQCRQIMSPTVQQAINQALTRKIGADPGGWDITQVLRMPGTYNFKYSVNGDGAEVHVRWDDGPVYNVRDLMRKLGLSVDDLRPSVSPVSEGEAHDSGSAADGARRQLPRRARTLLKRPTNDRSAALYKVWQILLKEGWGEDEAVSAVMGSDLNKWKGRDGYLRQDYRRTMAKGDRGRNRRASVRANGSDGEGSTVTRDSGGSEDRPSSGWKWEDYGTFIETKFPRPRWLIKDIWQAGSYGVIAGAPKTSKSTIALCMAVSVASGRPMFNEFEVPKAGPVLFVQEENDRGVMQDRLIKIASSMGLLRGEQRKSLLKGSMGEKYVTNIDFSGVPIELLNRPGLNLRDEGHREMLSEKIAEAEPLLVVIDPLYRVVGGTDVSSMSEVTPVLNYLTKLGDTYRCAIVVIHHFRKARELNDKSWELYSADVAQEMVGSVAIHGWYDCGIFLRKTGYDGKVLSLRVDREFRADAPKAAVEASIEMGPPGDLKFVAKVRDYNLENWVVSIVEQHGGKVALSKLVKEVEMGARDVLKVVRGSERMEDVRWGTGRVVQFVA